MNEGERKKASKKGSVRKCIKNHMIWSIDTVYEIFLDGQYFDMMFILMIKNLMIFLMI